MSKIINIALGVVGAALLIGVGFLIYFHFHPKPPSTELDISYQRWSDAVSTNPDDSFSRANLAKTLLQMGNTDRAIQEFKTAIDQQPKNFEYMFQLGLAYVQAKDNANALDQFKQAADLAPAGSKYNYQFEAAQTAFNMGDLQTALTYVQASIKDSDVLWNSHYLLGQIYEKQGNKAQAKQEYQAAEKFVPGDQDLEAALKRVSG